MIWLGILLGLHLIGMGYWLSILVYFANIKKWHHILTTILIMVFWELFAVYRLIEDIFIDRRKKKTT